MYICILYKFDNLSICAIISHSNTHVHVNFPLNRFYRFSHFFPPLLVDSWNRNSLASNHGLLFDQIKTPIPENETKKRFGESAAGGLLKGEGEGGGDG